MADAMAAVPGGEIVPGLETAAALGTGMIGGLVGNVAGVVKGLTSGKLGTAEGTQEAAKFGSDVGKAMVYEPRSAKARDFLALLGKAIEETKIAGLNPATAIPAAPAIAPAARQGAQAAERGAAAVAEAIPARAATAAMPGVGAAETAATALRAERAADLPVPVRLTKGELTRDAEQLRFERETAKSDAIGAPLRERAQEKNKAIAQNFDAWIDQTGSQLPGTGSLVDTGKSVDRALTAKAEFYKGKINQAYNEARAAGEMEAPVGVAPLAEFLNSPEAIAARATGNAGVINGVEKALETFGAIQRTPEGQIIPGQIKINDIERVRQMVNEISSPGTPDGRFGPIIKGLIDQSTEGAGGEIYRRARMLRREYAREFDDRAMITSLMSEKKGSVDRKVAYEKVFDTAILNGSLDDIRSLRRTLQTAGKEGDAAWKDLQAQTVKYIRDETLSNAARDTAGQPIPSFAKLNGAIEKLDKSGKLDFVFGKKGAEQLRQLRDVVGDLQPPPGVVNTSNTTATIMAALAETSVLGGPVLTGLRQLKNYAAERKMKKRVNEALSDQAAP